MCGSLPLCAVHFLFCTFVCTPDRQRSIGKCSVERSCRVLGCTAGFPLGGKRRSKGHVARTVAFGCSVLSVWLHGPFSIYVVLSLYLMLPSRE